MKNKIMVYNNENTCLSDVLSTTDHVETTLKQVIAITAVLRFHKINTVYSRPRRALLGCLEVLGISYYINYAFRLFVHGIVWYCR